MDIGYTLLTKYSESLEGWGTGNKHRSHEREYKENCFSGFWLCAGVFIVCVCLGG